MQQKKKICKICGKETYIFSRGRCKGCASIQDTKPLVRTSIVQKKYTIPKQTQKNKEKRLTERMGYKEFFEKHINNILNNQICCQECGDKLQGLTGEVCHILSKSKSPEVALNDNNILYLCFYGNSCHNKFDNNLESRSKMKIFTLAIKKFKILEPLIINFTSEVTQLIKNSYE